MNIFIIKACKGAEMAEEFFKTSPHHSHVVWILLVPHHCNISAGLSAIVRRTARHPTYNVQAALQQRPLLHGFCDLIIRDVEIDVKISAQANDSRTFRIVDTSSISRLLTFSSRYGAVFSCRTKAC